MKNNTTQHTPGPWQLEAGRNIKTPNGEFFLSYGEDKHGNPLFRPVNGWVEMDANARLIAAAPDLLKALKHLTENALDMGWSDQILIDAHAAITAATGE